jgi:hypothetical protein
MANSYRFQLRRQRFLWPRIHEVCSESRHLRNNRHLACLDAEDCGFDVVFRLWLSLRRFGSLERGDLVRVPIFCCPKNCILRSQISLRTKIAHDETALVVSKMAFSPDGMLSSMACPRYRLCIISDVFAVAFDRRNRRVMLRSNDPNCHIGEQIAYYRTIPQKSGPSHFALRGMCFGWIRNSLTCPTLILHQRGIGAQAKQMKLAAFMTVLGFFTCR